MILYNDEIHDLSQIIVKDCLEIDEDQIKTVPTPKLLEIFKNVKNTKLKREIILLASWSFG